MGRDERITAGEDLLNDLKVRPAKKKRQDSGGRDPKGGRMMMMKVLYSVPARDGRWQKGSY